MSIGNAGHAAFGERPLVCGTVARSAMAADFGMQMALVGSD